MFYSPISGPSDASFFIVNLDYIYIYLLVKMQISSHHSQIGGELKSAFPKHAKFTYQ